MASEFPLRKLLGRAISCMPPCVLPNPSIPTNVLVGRVDGLFNGHVTRYVMLESSSIHLLNFASLCSMWDECLKDTSKCLQYARYISILACKHVFGEHSRPVPLSELHSSTEQHSRPHTAYTANIRRLEAPAVCTFASL
jgi:hypothetical protein